MPTTEQVNAAEKEMHDAQHLVFEYVQGPESSQLDPAKYHTLCEAARKATNRYAWLLYGVSAKIRYSK